MVQKIKAYVSRKSKLKILVVGVVMLVFAALGVTLLTDSNAATVQAKQADSLIESMGVATHLRYEGQDVFDGTWKPRLCEMGIRYIRDGGRDNRFFQNLNTLHRECGIKSTLVMDSRDGNTPSNAVSGGIMPVIDAVTAVEGPNEWDLGGGNGYNGQNFPQNVRSYQNALYDAIKGHADPRVRNITVASPSMANPSRGNDVGPIKCDVGNMHSYSGSMNLPDDKLLTKWIPPTKVMCPGKPIIVTEAGYCNDNSASGCTGQGGVSERTLAKYALRHWLENYLVGIQRDHLYNLSLDNWSAFLRSDKSPKPAFFAAKSFISLVEDPGADFTPSSLNYEISGGDTSNMRQLLLQKRDGTFQLLVWLNVLSTPGGNNNHTDKDTSRNMTLTLSSAASGKIYLPTFNGTVAQQTFTSATSIPITVRDQVMIIEIGGSGTPNPNPNPNPSPNPNPNPNPNPGPGALPVRLNAGGPDYADPSGNVWRSDTAFVTGGQTNTQGEGREIANTTLDALYQSERWVDGTEMSYAITVPNGTHKLRLHFAEIYDPQPTGQRRFAASAEGRSLFENYDIMDAVGKYAADVKEYSISVTDGQLNVVLTPGGAKLSALEIISSTGTPTGADLTGDGKVNIADLSKLLSNFGKPAGPSGGDLNQDGVVNIADLSRLLTSWTG